jgi:hypothetical protein
VCRFHCGCQMYTVSNGSTEDLVFVFILTMCVYVETFFSFPLKVNLCCVIFASDAFLLLVYLSVNTLIFLTYVHDWAELLHTLEQKRNIIQSYWKVYWECVFIVERELTGKQVRKMKGLEGWRNLVCAFEVRISCVFIEKY